MKKIFILGASSDVGVNVTEQFLKSGWHVTAHYNKSNKKLIYLKSKYKEIDIIKFDLRNIFKFEKYLKSKRNLFKNYDAFVSLTGYLKPTSFEKFKASDVIEHFNVNYLTNLLVIREVVKGMEKRKNGRIVLSSSIGTKFGGGLNSLGYSISKFNNEFFPIYFKKLYSKNITINTLQIGVTDTKIHDNLKFKNMKKRIKLIPLKRMASIQEVTAYIYFLCHEKNKLLTGSVINISGGE